MLAEAGALIGEPKPIQHPVKFYERGDRPLEIVSSRQWYVRTLVIRERLLERGRELRWHPPHMRHRFEAWVEGLNGDWNISRQRFFGVSFPVWYPVHEDGSIDHDHPLLAADDRLPVDPSSDVPEGYARTNGESPGASSVTPTSWTPGPPPHSPRRSRAAGRTTPTSSRGCSPWISDPRRTRSSGPGCSARSCGPNSSTAVCRGRHRHLRLGSRPGTQEDVEVARQRGDPAAPFGVPWRRRGAVLGGERPARGRYGGGRGADEGGSASRHQSPQRLTFALTRLGTQTADHTTAVTAPLDLAMFAGSRMSSSKPRRHWTRTTTHAPWSAPRPSSGRFVTTTSNW